MRIAFFLHQFPGLSTTFILDQMTGLLDRGHQLDIYANEYGDYPKVHPEIERYGLLERTAYFRPTAKNPVSTILRGLGLLAAARPKAPALRALNVFAYDRHAYSMRLLYGVASLQPYPRRYDVLHAHFGPAGIKAALLREVGALSGKLVTTFYGYDVSQYPKHYGQHVYRRHLFAHGDLFLTLSRHMEQRLVALGSNPAKTDVHHLGIDPKRFAFKPRRWQPGEPARLISVARHTEKKGLPYAIEAVARLATRYQVAYHIIGDGPLRPQLEALIRDLGVGEQVHLLGWQPRPEVVAALDRAHLFLAPSVVAPDGDEEGTPTAIMEAASAGMPVVSTWHTGIPEVVQDGTSGLLVPERDVDALEAALVQLLDHSERWPEMGRGGRAHIETAFDITKLNDRLVERYEALLQG